MHILALFMIKRRNLTLDSFVNILEKMKGMENGQRNSIKNVNKEAVMTNNFLTSYIGHQITLPGHFDAPVVLEDARPLGPDDSAGYECRVRLPDGTLEEAVISGDEAALILGRELTEAESQLPSTLKNFVS